MSLPADLGIELDPTLDLVLDRVVPVSAEKLWRAWTTPKHIEGWFCPKPWYVTDCEVDLRPGGRFRTVMHGPAGERFDNVGCYLEIEPGRKLVWTDALLPGFRPSGAPFMTAYLFLLPHPEGTRYVAIARHADVDTTEKHKAMGFHEGWGAVLDQLVAILQAEG